MMRRIAGIVVFVVVLPPFVVLAYAEILTGLWQWLRTGKSGMDVRILDDKRPLNWVMLLPGRIGGWDE